MKENAAYVVKEEFAVPKNRNVLKDQLIYFPSQAKAGEEPCLFRRVEIWDEDQQESMAFLTNQLEFGATTIAAIFKDRWQVELFFDDSTFCTPSDVMGFQAPVALN